MTERIDLLQKAKDIYIPIHHTVELSLMATRFMGTKYFQRLSKLKQLGTCHYVYPSAVHTRFEHSIGVYYLASKLVDRIQRVSDVEQIHSYLSIVPELKEYYSIHPDEKGLTNWIGELIKIAGLLHDIGHGPYSHVFDDVFLKDSTHPMASHESRSCKILELIVKSDPMLECISDSEIKFMQQLIDPNKTRSGFVYQIVSNTLNGLDVDKYDYLARDSVHLGIMSSFNHMRLIENIMIIDNNIVFPEQSKQDIFNMFLTRHSMHRNVYNHKAVVSAQFIITEIMTILNPIIKIQESIQDMTKFIKMTDEYILQYAEIILSNPEMFDSIDFVKLQDLMDRLNTHNLYPHVGTIYGDINIMAINKRFVGDQYRVFSNKIGYVSGNKSNPLDNVYVYRTKDRYKSIKINKTDITNLVPVNYQEQILMVFKVDRVDLELDRKYFDGISV